MPVYNLDGIKIATGEVSIDNSAGATDLTQNSTINVGELNTIYEVLAVTVIGSATINSISISGNTVTINNTVPAGATATIKISVIGH